MPARRAGSAAAAPTLPRQSSRGRRDERRPVKVAFAGALAAAVPTTVIGGMVAGRAGVAGALVGIGLVLVLFGLGASLMMWAGRRGPSTLALVAGLGVSGRLMLYAAVLLALDGADIVHRPSLAGAAAVTLIITLAGEMTVLSRTPSLYQLDVPEGLPSARPAPLTRPDPHKPDRAEPRPAAPTSPSHRRRAATSAAPDRSTT